jgi:integrase
MDIHKFEEKIAQAYKLLERKNISGENRKLILEYHRMQKAMGHSLAHQHKCLFCLMKVAELTDKSLLSLDRNAVESLVIRINQFQVSEKTKGLLKQTLKTFVKVMNKGKVPESYEWVSTKIPRNKIKRISPTELVSREEQERMLQSCENLRDKCLISLLFDTAMRIGEALNVKLGDISSDDNGFLVQVRETKSNQRTVRVKNSTSFLSIWLNQHPEKDNPDAYLFPNPRNKGVLGYNAARKVIMVAQGKAGVKRFRVHMSRHTRITELLKEGVPLPLVSKYVGATEKVILDSYSHLCYTDIDKHLLSAEESKTQSCLKCGFPNSLEASYCVKCGAILKLNDLLSAFELMVRKVNDLEEKIKRWEKGEKLFELK